MSDDDLLVLFGPQRCGFSEQIFERTQHERQRRPELVADVRKENSLGPIDLGQHVGAFLFFFDRPRVLDCRSHLGRDQFEKGEMVDM